MISIWFLITGIIFGTICSISAKRKNRHAENWFTLGLFFWFFALIANYYLPDNNAAKNLILEEETESEEKFSFPY